MISSIWTFNTATSNAWDTFKPSVVASEQMQHSLGTCTVTSDVQGAFGTVNEADLDSQHCRGADSVRRYSLVKFLPWVKLNLSGWTERAWQFPPAVISFISEIVGTGEYFLRDLTQERPNLSLFVMTVVSQSSSINPYTVYTVYWFRWMTGPGPALRSLRAVRLK